MIFFLPFCHFTRKTFSRNLRKDINTFFHNLIYNSTKPLPFENLPTNIYSVPLVREHHDSYLCYLYSKQITHESEDPTIKITFPPLENDNTDKFPKFIHGPEFLTTLKEHSTDSFSPTILPLAIETLLTKLSHFEISDIQQRCPIEDNRHHWLTHDI